ncbi:MAG TPA: hypothetical protein PKY56_09120 [Candidatus Kapabacteria bacterium]|nr:hypothetical protein [Candidatus Kapabacteria bacterium]HPO62462.1 hypothetical protein [Candidatus Kapabacteria bacterium]
MKNLKVKLMLQLIALVIIFLNAKELFTFTYRTAIPSLIIPPSAFNHSIGGAGVAVPTDDAFNVFSNPALLGLSSRETNFSANFYPENIKIKPFGGDPYFYNFAISAGINLDKQMGIPLSLGIGYLRQYSDLGEHIRTREDGAAIGAYRSEESANSFFLAASTEFWVKLALGFGVKFISPESNPILIDEDITAFDFGIIAVAPIVKDYVLSDELSGNFNFSAGYSLKNLGNEIKYNFNHDFIIYTYEREYYRPKPLPRTERLGIGLNINFDYDFKGTKIKILNVDFTSEANADLVKIDSLGYEYRPILSETNIWKNIIQAKSSENVINRLGWRLNLFEFVSYSDGRKFEYYPYSDLNYTTSGFSIETTGIFKILNALIGNSDFGYIANHFNLRFSYAEIKGEAGVLGFNNYKNIELIVKGFSF